MHIAIAGHTGFLGTELKKVFEAKGYKLTLLDRADIYAEPEALAEKLEGTHALINLAGAPIIKRWTKKYSRKLWSSRIDTTACMVEAIRFCKKPPSVFCSGSAVGIYADTGVHDESSRNFDEGFLGTLCIRWEEEAAKAKDICKVYHIRTGIILGERGGALPKMALPFRLFVGGKIGNGRQMLSWMHIDDFTAAMSYLLEQQPQTGAYNFTAPQPVSNADFSRLLSETLNRPNLFTVPGFTLKLLYGEGAVTLLSGQYVLPGHLEKGGFKFRYAYLKDALQDLLTK